MALRKMKILAWGLAAFAALVLTVMAAGYFVLRSEKARNWVLDKARAEILAQTGARLEIQSVSGTLLRRLQLQGIKLVKKKRVLLAAQELEIEHNPLTLLGGRLGITLLRINSPRVNLPLALDSGGESGGVLPLMISVRRLVVQDGRLTPQEPWGPVRGLSDIELAGSLGLGLMGPSFNLQVKKAKLLLEGEKPPVVLDGKAQFSGWKLKFAPLRLLQGPNALELTGTVDCRQPLAFDTRLKGTLAELASLPFAWPGPRPPDGPLGFDLGLKGPMAKCGLNGRFTLTDQSLDLSGRLNLENISGRLSAETAKLDPHAWGLSPVPVEIKGVVDLESSGPLDDSATKLKINLDLGLLKIFGVVAKEVKLTATLGQNLAEMKNFRAGGDWGRLEGSGQAEQPWDLAQSAIDFSVRFQNLTPPAALAPNLPLPLKKTNLQGEVRIKGSAQKLGFDLEMGPSRVADGAEIKKLSARGILKPGALRLDSMAVQGPWGNVTAQGEALPSGVNMDFTLDQLVLEKVIATAKALGAKLPAKIGVIKGSLTAKGNVNGPWRGPAVRLDDLKTQGTWGRLSIRGSADPKRAGLDFNLNKGNLQGLAALLQALDLVPPEATGVKGTLAVKGRFSGPWAKPRVDIQDLQSAGDWGRLSAKGAADLTKGDIEFGLSEGRLKELFGLARALGLDLPPKTAQLDGSLKAAGRFSGPWKRPEVLVKDLEAKGDWGRLSARGSVGQKKADLNFEIKDGDIQRLAVFCKAMGLDLPGQITAIRGTFSAKGRVRGTWGNPILRLENLEIKGFWGRLSVRGSADLARGDLDFDLEDGGLGGLTSLVKDLGIALPGPVAGLRGSFSAQGSLRGPWSGPAFTLTAKATDWQSHAVKARETKIKLEQARLAPRPYGRLEITALGLTAGNQSWERIQASARLSPEGGDLKVAASSANLNLGFTIKSSDPWARPLKATLEDLSLKQTGQKAWTQSAPARFILSEEEASLSGFNLSQNGQKFFMQGKAESSGRISGLITIENLLLAPWAPKKRIPEKAALTIRAEAGGTLQSPIFSLTGGVAGLVWRRVPPVKITFAGGYRDKKLSFRGQAISNDQEVFDLNAELGLALSLKPLLWEPTPKGLKASAWAKDFPLPLLEPILVGLSYVRGSARLEFSAHGSLQDPDIKGNFDLKNGAFTVKALDQRFRGLNVRLAMDGRKIKIEEISLQREGSLLLRGLVVLPGQNAPGEVDLNLATKDLTLSLGPWGQVTSSSEFKFQGNLKKPVIKGTITPQAVNLVWGMAPPADLKDVVIIKPGQQPPPIGWRKKPRVYTPGGFLTQASLDVLVDLSQGLRINVGEGWLLINGRPRVGKKPGGPIIYHDRIEITRGLILVFGKAFQVEKGMVDFADKDLPDPNLFGEATIGLGNTQIFVSLSGKASDPNIQLTSLPSMSQTDIMSTIIFGRSANSLSQDQSSALSAQAAALLGQVGASEIKKIVGRELAPDVVTVHSEVEGGSSLEAGKYLSSDLYLRYRRRMDQEGGQNVGIEYRVRDWISLESQVGDTRDSGVDVIFNFDF